MDLPLKSDWQQVPRLRYQALAALRPDVGQSVRGQYAGYQEEVQNPGSTVETYASIMFESSSPRWEGVPIILSTGKSLESKATYIRLYYRQEEAVEANELELRIQPREGIELTLWSKKPGYEREIEKVLLKFNYEDNADALPEAYEQVLLDTIRGDRTLFTTSDEVVAAWTAIDPIQSSWSTRVDDMIIYEAGTSAERIRQKHTK